MGELSKLDRTLIEKKLLEKLSLEEVKRFDERMNDQMFSEVFEIEKLIYHGTLEIGDAQLKDTFREFESNQTDVKSSGEEVLAKLTPKSKTNRNGRQNLLRWIMLGIIAGLAAYLIPKTISKKSLDNTDAKVPMAALYKPYPNVAFNLERSTDQPLDLFDAFAAYDKEEYQKAYDALIQIPEKDRSQELNFYLGQCQIALKKYRSAVDLLRKAGKGGSPFEYHSKYYLAISFYELGQRNRAIPTLEELLIKTENESSDNAVYWHDRTRQLLSQFRSVKE